MTISGLYSISAEEYHADTSSEVPRLSSSIARILLDQSPLHAWWNHPRLNPNYERKDKTAFDLGNVGHSLILEGDVTKVKVIRGFDDWRKKEAKARRDLARLDGKIPLLEDQWEMVQGMAAALKPQLESVEKPRPFTNGKAEQAVYWTQDDVACRGRIDWLHDDYRYIDDLKTVGGSANPEAWTGPRGPLVSLGFDLEAAFHSAAIKALFDVEPVFRFIVVENTPPYACSVVALGPEFMAFAQRKMRLALNLWRECLRTNTWPGYPRRICWADLPVWAEANWMEREARGVTPPLVQTGIEDDGRPLVDQLWGDER